MTSESITLIFREAMKTVLIIGSPLLLSILITGLIISILQAATQINEQTLSFIPKILSVLGIVAIFGPWMLEIMLDYMQNLFNNIPLNIR